MNKQDIKTEFGNNLRAERNRRNYSQEKLAELAGLSYFTHIGKIENGKLDIELTTIVKLLSALNIPFETLIDVNKFKDQ